MVISYYLQHNIKQEADLYIFMNGSVPFKDMYRTGEMTQSSAYGRTSVQILNTVFKKQHASAWFYTLHAGRLRQGSLFADQPA